MPVRRAFTPAPPPRAASNNALSEIRRRPADVSAHKISSFLSSRVFRVSRFPGESFKRSDVGRTLRSVVDPQTNTRYRVSLPSLFTTYAASSPTGNLLYAVTERYVDALGVKEHMRIGAERWSGFPQLAELVRDFGCFAQPNGVQLTTLKDTAEACVTRKGDVTLSLGIVVPASKERELDALFALHEAFMRETHVLSGDVANPMMHDDLKAPRLTHFSVNKAFELNDPFDETKGFTGAVQYSIAETYVNANGIQGHFSFKERYPEVFEGVVNNFTDPAYARFADVGGGRVISAQSSKMDNFASNIIGGVKKALDELLPRRAPHEEFCEDYCPEEW